MFVFNLYGKERKCWHIQILCRPEILSSSQVYWLKGKEQWKTKSRKQSLLRKKQSLRKDEREITELFWKLIFSVRQNSLWKNSVIFPEGIQRSSVPHIVPFQVIVKADIYHIYLFFINKWWLDPATSLAAGEQFYWSCFSLSVRSVHINLGERSSPQSYSDPHNTGAGSNFRWSLSQMFSTSAWQSVK